ncbi:TetR/AcrR family transcriptional regulator [Spirosoma koreense]
MRPVFNNGLPNHRTGNMAALPLPTDNVFTLLNRHMRLEKKRNRSSTKRRIIGALQAVIAEKGLTGITISEVALRAQVSKVLVYRYFGNVEGLLDYYIHQGPIYPSLYSHEPDNRLFLPPGDELNLWSSRITQLFRGLRCSKGDRELLKAALTDGDELTTRLRQAQNAQLNEFVDHLLQRVHFPGQDPQATMAILLGGLSYLTILAHADRPMLGIDLRSEAGWHRIEIALKSLFQAIQKSRTTPGSHWEASLLDQLNAENLPNSYTGKR